MILGQTSEAVSRFSKIKMIGKSIKKMRNNPWVIYSPIISH